MGSAIFSFGKETIKRLKPLEEYIRSIYTLQLIQEPFTTTGVEALKEWTGKTRATIVYDSIADEFTHNGLFGKVKGKSNIALVATTTDGDVFGGFYSVAVTEQDKWFKDPDTFAFSFESHGRCKTPQRFFVKERLKERASVVFYKDNIYAFVAFSVLGDGSFCLGNERTETSCWNLSRCFEGIENTTLTGNDRVLHQRPYYHCTRLVAVQVE